MDANIVNEVNRKIKNDKKKKNTLYKEKGIYIHICIYKYEEPFTQSVYPSIFLLFIQMTGGRPSLDKLY